MTPLETWKDIMASGDTERLSDLIDDDCVFYSPVVHTPQVGKPITLLYLTGAAHALHDEFRYVNEVVADPCTVLEFECKVGDILVNGIDMISFNDDGKIVEFKVMIRPLKAIQAVHASMGRMLKELSEAKAAS